MKNNQANKLKQPLNKLKKELPRIVSSMLITAKDWYVLNFRKQGFDNNGVEKWAKRKRDRYRTRSGKVVDDTTRAILIGKGSGMLRRSLATKKLSLLRGAIVSDLPYANIHNEGLIGKAFGRHNFKMPKRQYVGYSERLNKNLIFVITGRINRVFS